ncbi:lytic transglycosylase domain-containing protein [Trichlorobacter ammonificans]|uniref:Transglycosylase SLT domain-containing protein n=1 Tax=Trichlorobacter ammonificans TaxID=2916410 RepID=A0ABN8HGS3_9BACT|nr:lytic transglycosylase domain-containing protein [Trichlorobacter ammonificans]CAH2032023.1 Transglycosylase SLT domain-containing protein [Trichlorobacter ammonificans]
MALNPAQFTLPSLALATERKAAPSGAPAASSRFAERLERIAVQEARLKQGSPEELHQAAESLRLSTLRTSLNALLDDESVDSAPLLPLPTALPQAPAVMQSYLANLPADAPKAAAPPQQRMLADADVSGVISGEPAAAPRSERSSPGLDHLIEKASRRYGVEAGLIRAVIKAESNFNPRAVSHAGAQGLMQLMPATARGLGVTDSFDPEQNIMGGTRFLRSLLDRYNGDVDSALAAYNWGPGNVDRKPDRLPRETREYLVKVKQYYTGFTA